MFQLRDSPLTLDVIWNEHVRPRLHHGNCNRIFSTPTADGSAGDLLQGLYRHFDTASTQELALLSLSQIVLYLALFFATDPSTLYGGLELPHDVYAQDLLQ